MRLLVGMILVALVACGGSQPRKECFECGLSDQWAHAERERAAREQAEHDAHMREISRAVRLGEAGTDRDARLISETIYQGERDALAQLVSSLEKTCQRQHPLAMAWTLHELLTGTLRQASEGDVDELRERAFYLIAVSRGDDSRADLGRCQNSPIEAVCARALATIDERHGTCQQPATAEPPVPESTPRGNIAE